MTNAFKQQDSFLKDLVIIPAYENYKELSSGDNREFTKKLQ